MKRIIQVVLNYLFLSHIIRISSGIIFLTSLVVLSGCATNLQYDPSILRFDTPEVSGATLAGSAQYHIASTGTRVMATIDQSLFGDTQYSDRAYSENTGTIGGRVGMGLMDHMDVYLRSSSGSTPVVGVKYQIIGATPSYNMTTTDSNDQSGWKITLSTEYGRLNDPGDNSNLKMSTFDFSANLGYRFNSQWIVYVNNFYSNNKISGSINRKNLNYSIEGTSRGLGHVFGVSYRMKKNTKISEWMIFPYVTFEFGNGKFNWLKTNSNIGKGSDNNDLDEVESAIGLSAGFNWK